MGILGWILFGLVVGALAKLIMPGRDPGGIIVTMLLGIAGAALAGAALTWAVHAAWGGELTVGDVSMLIAAVALSLGKTTVVSADNDLTAVPGLAVQNWVVRSEEGIS